MSKHARRPTGRAWMARYVTSVARRGRPTRATLAELLVSFRARGRAAHPSQRWLANKLGVCERTIRRWTKSLEADGSLDVQRHAAHHDPISGRWRRRTNRYRCRFANAKRTPRPGDVQVRPSGHSCPQDAPHGAGDVAGPAPVGADPPSPPPWIAAGMTPIEWTKRKMGALP